MKIGIVGNSGHGVTIQEQLKHPQVYPLEVCGCCPGFPEEAMGGIRKILMEKEGTPHFDSFLEMLEVAKPDLVVIDGKFCDHAPMAVQALRQGIHVYLDKPVATTLEQLMDLKTACEQSTAQIGAMFTTRYEAPFFTAKQYIEQGIIGKIRLIQAQKSYKLGQRPEFFKSRQEFGGLTPWVSIHMIDLILWLTGQPCRTVYSSHSALENRGYGELEMISLCQMELEGEILASVNTDYYRPNGAPTHGDDRIRIVGTKGILEIRDNTLFLLDDTHCQAMELVSPPDLFGDFLLRIRDALPMDGLDGLYSTYVSLMLRQSADDKRILSLTEGRSV